MSRLNQEQAIEKARKLVRLATHRNTPEKEATRAAVMACKYIRKYKLLDDPFGDIARHPAAQKVKAIHDAVDGLAVTLTGKRAVDLAGDAIRRARTSR